MKRPNERSRLIRYNQVSRMLNLSKTTIRRMQRDGEFPQPFQVGSRAVAFDRLEIEDWLRRQKAQRKAS